MKHVNEFEEYVDIDKKYPNILEVYMYLYKFDKEIVCLFLNILFKNKDIRIKNTYSNSSSDTSGVVDIFYMPVYNGKNNPIIFLKLKNDINDVWISQATTIYYKDDQKNTFGTLDIESVLKKAETEINMKKYNL